MRMRTWFVLAALTSLRCGGGGSGFLAVDVRTDYAPGIEFDLVVAELPDSSAREEIGAVNSLESVMAFLRGRRLARFEEIPDGATTLHVSLVRTRDGSTVARRTVTVDVAGDTVVTVVLSRLCEGIVCPTASDAADATECVEGRCVSPECSPENPDACVGVGCTRDDECEGPSLASCARLTCSDEGSCLVERDDASCGEGFYCEAESGCTELEGPACGEACDPGVPCMQGEFDCASGTCRATGRAPAGTACTLGGADGMCDAGGSCSTDCVPDVPCTRADACEAGRTRCEAGAVVCESAGPKAAGVTCREAAGLCDLAESCDGTAITCPDDMAVGAGTECRAAAGSCDAPAVCDGIGATCPANVPRGSGASCLLPSGSMGFCDGIGTACMDGCVPGAPCVPAPCQTGAFECDSGSPVCRMTGVIADGTTCSPSDIGAWSGCSYGSECAEAGTESRTVVTHTCAAGSCGSNLGSEMRGCVRETEGMGCGAGFSCPGYGACMFPDACATGGTQSRNCTNQTCVAGSCNAAVVPQNQGCSRPSQNGASCSSCGTPVCACGGTTCSRVTTVVDVRMDGSGTLSANCSGFGSCSGVGNGMSCTMVCPLGVGVTMSCTDIPGGDAAAHLLQNGVQCDCTVASTSSCSGTVTTDLDIDCGVDERCS